MLLNFRKAGIFQEFAEDLLLICVLLNLRKCSTPLENLGNSWCMHQTRLFSVASVVPQTKSTELCSLAAVVPQSKSTEM